MGRTETGCTEPYPPIEPFRTGTLAVDSRHSIYWEECGNPDGVPILFVHGGPGAGAHAPDRCFFDPEHFRIVLFDQRGCGRSRPTGELRDNTTDHLVADMEQLREELHIERWHVFGGSWGSTLGIYYAEQHPDRVASLVLRGIWLFRQSDLQWWLDGLRWLRPEAWRAFAEHVPPHERQDLLESYYRRLIEGDRDTALAAAKAWSHYEISSCTLLPNPAFEAEFDDDDVASCLARLEAHYFRNCRFDPDSLLLDRIDRLRRIPGVIVHGRYDLVCPILGADLLHRAWPEASYVIVEDAGHSSREPGIEKALLAATERIKASGTPVL